VTEAIIERLDVSRHDESAHSRPISPLTEGVAVDMLAAWTVTQSGGRHW
jgi:hypothetical protein